MAGQAAPLGLQDSQSRWAPGTSEASPPHICSESASSQFARPVSSPCSGPGPLHQDPPCGLSGGEGDPAQNLACSGWQAVSLSSQATSSCVSVRVWTGVGWCCLPGGAGLRPHTSRGRASHWPAVPLCALGRRPSLPAVPCVHRLVFPASRARGVLVNRAADDTFIPRAADGVNLWLPLPPG